MYLLSNQTCMRSVCIRDCRKMLQSKWHGETEQVNIRTTNHADTRQFLGLTHSLLSVLNQFHIPCPLYHSTLSVGSRFTGVPIHEYQIWSKTHYFTAVEPCNGQNKQAAMLIIISVPSNLQTEVLYLLTTSVP